MERTQLKNAGIDIMLPPFSVPSSVVKLAKIFSKNGIDLYLVGGFVRNSLLNRPASDLDAASSAVPEDVISFLEKEDNIQVIEKALDFGTIEIRIAEESHTTVVEHTTFRKEIYHSDGSHRPDAVAFTDSLTQDAMRRDFTINAIYYHILDCEIIDPLSGKKDIESMMIRAAREEAEATLSDDGLRIMRMARFAAELNFMVDPDLVRAARQYAHYMKDISPERKQIEMKKILLSDVKYQRFNGAFNTSKPKRGLLILKETGALKYIFPLLTEGSRVKQNPIYHAHDVLMHNINVMSNTTPSYPLRLAGLLHDIAKPEMLDKTGKMHHHDHVGSKRARQALDDLKTPKAITEHVCVLIQNHMFDLNGKAKDKTIRKKAAELGYDLMIELADLRCADIIGSGIREQSPTADHWVNVVETMIKEGAPESMKDLAVDGRELMRELNITEGEAVGKLLKRLRQIAIQKPSQNTHARLLRHAKRVIKEREFKHD